MEKNDLSLLAAGNGDLQPAFVYGTLMKGERAEHLLAEATSIRSVNRWWKCWMNTRKRVLCTIARPLLYGWVITPFRLKPTYTKRMFPGVLLCGKPGTTELE